MPSFPPPFLIGGEALMTISGNENLTYAVIMHKADESSERRVHEAIMRDLARTFPTNVYFMDRQGKGQLALYKVLCAYAAYDPEVGKGMMRRFGIGRRIGIREL
jgi:hypothetical protein